MRRLLLTLLALSAMAVTAPVALADPAAGPQRVAEQAVADTAAACRRDTPASDSQCASVPLAPPVSAASIARYEAGDVHRALQLQYELGNSLPFSVASWLGTHNSFNTTTRSATASGLDANQQLSMTDQLRLDMRSLEVDAHWFPSSRAGGAFAPVLCHARGADQKHAGCTNEPLLIDGLTEIAAWLRTHPRQVLLLYVEDHLETAVGHTQGAQALHAAFGNMLYAPAGASCVPLPLDRSRDDVLAAGKQVVIISGCAEGAGWNGAIFSGAARAKDETGAAGYGEDGTCDPARAPAAFDAHLLRVFEDSTALSATVSQGSNPITAKKAATLQRCAVDITGFDQLLPDDGRLASSVWSWAPGEPTAAGACTAAGADGRWRSVSCQGRRATACLAANGSWSVGPVAPRAAARCNTGTFAVPRYGYQGSQLAAAIVAAHVDSVWLNYRLSGVGKVRRT